MSFIKPYSALGSYLHCNFIMSILVLWQTAGHSNVHNIHPSCVQDRLKSKSFSIILALKVNSKGR